MFLFYSPLSSLTLIIFLPFENLASLPLLFLLSASLPLSRVCCCLIPIANLARSLSLAVVVVFFWLLAVIQSLWFWLVPDRSSWIIGGGPISVVRWLVEWVVDVGWGGCLAGACERGDHAFFLF